MKQHKKKYVERAKRLSQKCRTKTVKTDVEDIIKSAVDSIVDKIQQDVCGNLAEVMQGSMIKFNKYFFEKIFNSQEFSIPVDDVIPVLPDNTKYYSKRGKDAVIVLEYKPQVRTLLVINFLTYCCTSERSASALTDKERMPIPVALALPYVVLTLVFRKNTFHGLWLHYRNEPLSSLSDSLYMSNLPNIRDGKVCLGIRYNSKFVNDIAILSLKEQVEKIASAFWQTVFNNDYSIQQRMYANENDVFATVKNWHKATQINPLFVLDVEWIRDNTHATLHELIKAFFPIPSNIAPIEAIMHEALKIVTKDLNNVLTNNKNNIKIVNSNVVANAIHVKLDTAVAQKLKELAKLKPSMI